MVIGFDKLPSSVAEMQAYPLDTQFMTVALGVAALCSYDPKAPDNYHDMLQYLMGSAQQLSPFMKSNIRDRMTQNNKWGFIGKSYFKGAVPQNDYTPEQPYTIEITENPYSYKDEGFARLFVKSGGADNARPITVRKMKNGSWVLCSDSIIGLMTDIRPPESENPWA